MPDALRAVVGKREERFSLKTREPEEAKRLHAAALLEVETRWANLAQPERSISEREAIARPAYEWLRGQYADNPSQQTLWDPMLYEEQFASPPPFAAGMTLSEFLLAPPEMTPQKQMMLRLLDERTDELIQRSGKGIRNVAVPAIISNDSLKAAREGRTGTAPACPIRWPPFRT